jgi:cathepsin L
MKPVEMLPRSVDWRQTTPTVVSSVKDQGHCGSCWAFAATATLESHVAIQSGLLFDLSPQQLAM